MTQTQRTVTKEEQTLLENLQQSKNGLPLPLHRVIDGWCDSIKTRNNALVEEIIAFLNRIVPALIEKDAQNVWEKLVSLSENSTTSFLIELCSIENDYKREMTWVHHQFNIRQQSIKIVRVIEKLETEIENYNNNCEDKHRYWKSKLKGLKEIKEELNDDIKNHEQYKNLDDFATYHFPVSRKYKNEPEALCIYFLKKIYLLFKEHYGKPMYNNIAIFIKAIFEIDYSHDEIASTVKDIRYARKFGRLKDQRKTSSQLYEKVKVSLI